MSKSKLTAAKEFMEEKRYHEARTILQSMNHPEAYELLKELDTLDPDAKRIPATPPSTETEQKVSSRTENRPSKVDQITSGIELILAGIFCFFMSYNFGFEKLFIPVGLACLLIGIYRIRDQIRNWR